MSILSSKKIVDDKENFIHCKTLLQDALKNYTKEVMLWSQTAKGRTQDSSKQILDEFETTVSYLDEVSGWYDIENVLERFKRIYQSARICGFHAVTDATSTVHYWVLVISLMLGLAEQERGAIRKVDWNKHSAILK